MNDIEMYNAFIFATFVVVGLVLGYALIQFCLLVAAYFGVSGWAVFGGFVAINMIISGPAIVYRS